MGSPVALPGPVGRNRMHLTAWTIPVTRASSYHRCGQPRRAAFAIRSTSTSTATSSRHVGLGFGIHLLRRCCVARLGEAHRRRAARRFPKYELRQPMQRATPATCAVSVELPSRSTRAYITARCAWQSVETRPSADVLRLVDVDVPTPGPGEGSCAPTAITRTSTTSTEYGRYARCRYPRPYIRMESLAPPPPPPSRVQWAKVVDGRSSNARGRDPEKAARSGDMRVRGSAGVDGVPMPETIAMTDAAAIP